MKIEIERYYIFCNITRGIRYYNTLQELQDNAPEQVKDFEKLMNDDDFYVAIGAEYTAQTGAGALDFINKKDRHSKFAWCKDVETENIEVPNGFETVLEDLIKVL